MRIFLLTDYEYEMERMFNVNDELVAYNDVGNLIDLAKYHLGAKDEREKSFERNARKGV
jgi:spore maturation protein CgeB